MADEPGSAPAGNPAILTGSSGASQAAGDAPVGTPPSAGASPSAVDFSSYLPPELKDHPALKSYDLKSGDGLGKVFKSLVSAQTMIGGEKIVIPTGKNDTPEAWTRAYEALGRPKEPKDYQLDKGFKPSTTPAGKEVEQRFRQVVHDAGLNARQFNAIYGFYNDLAADQQKKVVEGMKAGHERAVQVLREQWGDQFENRVALANKLLKAFGGSPDEIKHFTARFANEPVIIRVLAEAARRMEETSLIAGDKPDFDLGPGDAKQKRMDIMTNPNNPLNEAWKSKRHPRKQEAMEEVARLSAIIAGDER